MSFSKYLDFFHNDNLETVQNWFNDNIHLFLQAEAEEISYEKVYLRDNHAKVDYWQTKWGKMLLDPNINNPNSKVGKLFKVRFRIPFFLFQLYLVPQCEKKNVFKIQNPEFTRVPIQFKILMSLRILGRGNTYDDINDMSSIPNSSVARYFIQFCTGLASLFYEDVIEAAQASFLDRLAHYAALGLPGGMGSVDCTRIRWDKCPEWLRNWCIGKEKFPALAFLVICDHNRQIIYVGNHAYLGAMNDINIANMDPFMIALREGKFAQVEFTLLKEDGTRVPCYGTYLISDNGFFTSSVLMDPPKNRYSENQILWAEWLESVRKDIECLFGILKVRFRILLNRIQQHDVVNIRDIFMSCCILHNLINYTNPS